MAGQVDRRLCPRGLWLGDLLPARIAAMHVWAHISSHQESFLIHAHPSKIWYHDAGTRTICVGVENQILSVGVRACECTRVRPALRVTTNVSACECKLQHNVWDSPRATCWLGVTALRARERWSDWHEGVYGKQEQGLAGQPAITQEFTLVSSSLFFLFFFCVRLSAIQPFDTRDNGAVSLWHMWIIRLVTTTVCGSMLKMRCVCLISGKGVFAKEGNLSCLSPAKKKYWSVVLFIHQDFLERRWEVLEIFALELQLSDQYDRTSCH